MIKKIKVKHQHRYTLEKANLYNGEATYNVYDDYEELHYQEEDGTSVHVLIKEDYLEIKRNGEIQSTLTFIPSEKTNNLLKSAFGDFEVEIYTYNYQHQDHHVQIEYDVLSSNEEKDGYKIMFEMGENVNEFN